MLDWCSNRIARYVEVLRSQFVLCLADSVSVPSKVCDQGRSYDLRVVRVWSARARYCSECFDAKYVAYAGLCIISFTHCCSFVPKQSGKKDKTAYPDKLKELLPTRLGMLYT